MICIQLVKMKYDTKTAGPPRRIWARQGPALSGLVVSYKTVSYRNSETVSSEQSTSIEFKNLCQIEQITCDIFWSPSNISRMALHIETWNLPPMIAKLCDLVETVQIKGSSNCLRKLESVQNCDTNSPLIVELEKRNSTQNDHKKNLF